LEQGSWSAERALAITLQGSVAGVDELAGTADGLACGLSAEVLPRITVAPGAVDGWSSGPGKRRASVSGLGLAAGTVGDDRHLVVLALGRRGAGDGEAVLLERVHGGGGQAGDRWWP
jgi:hypothetical protein